MTLNDYFDKIVCINLKRRTDRWEHVQLQASRHQMVIERFEALDMPGDENTGCTMSHRAVLDYIIQKQIPRTLVLEDDFEARSPLMQRLFSDMIGEVPADCFILYLGGHYADKRISRVSKHVIRCGRMKTTSSYGVTLAAAREMAPMTHGAGPIDELYGKWNDEKPCYIFQPRLFVQYENYSDLQHRVMDNSQCMQDETHEKMV